MTQQAVSKNIAKMEDDLGVLLFYRDHHNVALTEIGKQYYMLLSRLSSEYENAVSQIKAANQDYCRTLKAGYQNWLDFGTVPNRALASMREENPNIFLIGERHSPVVLTNKLKNLEVDFAIMYERFAPQSPVFRSRLLFYSPNFLMVSVDHPLVTGDADYTTFNQEPFIFDSFENERSVDVSERAKRCIGDWGLHPSQVIVMPNRDSAYTAAEQGRGVIVTTEVNRITKSSALKKYSMHQAEPIVAVWLTDQPDCVVSNYIDLLAQEYQNESPMGQGIS
jgi:DNA-binding transcriptional LysR family regulator